MQSFITFSLALIAGLVVTSPSARAIDGQSDPLNCEEVMRILAHTQEPHDGTNHPFSGMTLDGDFSCLGDEPRFESFACFEGATFSGDVWLPHAVFEKGVSFQNVVFEGEAYFYDARFPAGADFAQAEFRGDAEFSSSEFYGHTEFQRAKFKGRSDFGGVCFDDVAYFEEAEFAKSTSFEHAKFYGDAVFDEVAFHEADFGWAEFNKYANFYDCVFTGKASFRSVQFFEGFGLKGSFSDSVTFAGATIDHWNAYEVRFGGYVDVTGVSIGEVFLRNIIFDKEVDFIGVSFLGPVEWEKVTFFRRADLRRAVFSAPVHWAFVTSESLRLGWFSSKLAEHLEPWPRTGNRSDMKEVTESFADVLTGLHAGFVERGQFNDRNAVYAIIKDHEFEGNWPIRMTIGFPSRWGTDLLRVVLVSLGLAAFMFAGFMFFGSGIKANSAERKPIEYGMRIRILERFVSEKKMADQESGRKRGSVSTRLAVALGITIRSFFKVGKGTTYWELSSRAMIWSRVSWCLGLFMLAHLIVTVKNTVPLVSLLFGELF